MYRPTAKSYFSGAGLMDLGLLNAGVDVIQSLEIDPVCVKTLQINFSHRIVCSDIKDMTVLNQPQSDIIVGTYPCTRYSTIADIHNTRTGDELFLHFFRHIALEKPQMYIVENVPGMRKFPVVMEAMTRLPDYYVHIFCPVDALKWLPQKRERLIVFGTKKRFSINEPEYHRRIPLSEIIESNPEMNIPEHVLNRINGKYRDRPIITDPKEAGSYAPTCVAHYAKDRGTRLVVDRSHPLGIRPYMVREYARLQGVPDSFAFSGSDNDAYRMIGNGVPVNLAEWVGKEALRYFN